MRRQTDLNIISQERAGVFGLAILWIMLFHSSLNFGWTPIHLIKSTGYAGVDVFLFLSGIGLFYSMEKDPSPAHFYKKRALRVLLPYLIVAVVYEGGRCLVGVSTPIEALANLTFVSYWKNGYAVYWFIAAVLVFYLVYPALYSVIKADQYWLQLLLLLLAFGTAWLLYQDQAAFYRINGFVFRIPIFLIGCFLAPLVKQGKALPAIPTAVVCALVSLGCVYLWIGCDPWFLRMYLFIPLSISLTLLGSMVLSLFKKEHPIQRVLLFFGGMTLELYLFHEKILAVLQKLLFPDWAGTWQVNALAVGLSIIFAWLLCHICEKIRK